MRRLAFVLALLVLGAPAARADEPRDAPAASLLFEQAREAMGRGDYAAACPKLEESLRLDHAPGTLLNLAACEEKVGRLADAWQHYRDLASELAGGDDRAPYVAERVRALDARVPRLTVRLVHAVAGTTVRRDGILVTDATDGVPLPINPGWHVIVVSAPERQERRYELLVPEGQRREVETEPGQPTAAATPPAAPAARRSSWIAPVAIGVGASAIATGLAAGAVALGKRSTVKSHCQGSACDGEGMRAAGGLDSLAMFSTVTLTVGAVALGVGIYLELTPGRAAPGPVGIAGVF
jgi:hypothetical protein